eukprot:TRINITY_DN20285_c0_g1_i1.p3 TRINITY_DN20285_c0_g1~~TRINITY_DN20285_c0_g1_i1.p3  ORF type:complete len:117 (-),score=21.68 TRINITY_DN20285_c0_g1_i1:234-584(-)
MAGAATSGAAALFLRTSLGSAARSRGAAAARGSVTSAGTGALLPVLTKVASPATAVAAPTATSSARAEVRDAALELLRAELTSPLTSPGRLPLGAEIAQPVFRRRWRDWGPRRRRI